MRPIAMRLDATDFAELYDRHARELLSFFARRTWNPEVAVDLLAETFAAAFEDRRQFRGEDLAGARSWLYGVARHQLLELLRRGVVERRALARLGVERPLLSDLEYDRIEELAGSQELRERVGEELDGLSGEQREVLRLRVIEGKPYAQVALELGVSEQAARARGSRALRALREAAGLCELMEATDNV